MTDENAPITLDEAARSMFPDGTVTAGTLRRRIRQGLLQAYKPGRSYLTRPSDIKDMLAATATKVKRERPANNGLVPNGLGLTESEIAEMASRRTLDELLAQGRKIKRRR